MRNEMTLNHASDDSGVVSTKSRAKSVPQEADHCGIPIATELHDGRDFTVMFNQQLEQLEQMS